MKRFLFFFVCLILSAGCFAQFRNFSVTASVVVPVLPDQKETVTVPAIRTAPSYSSYFATPIGFSVTESFTEKVGYQLGGKIDYNVTSKVFITASLNLQFLRFKRTSNANLASLSPIGVQGPFVYPAGGIINGVPAVRDPSSGTLLVYPANILPEPTNKMGNTELYYVQMPVTVGTSLSKRLLLRGGLLFSQLINARVQKQYVSYTNGISVSEKVEDSDEDFVSLSYGAIFEVSYRVAKNFSADLSMSRNFNSLYTGQERYSDKTKLNLLSLGVGYSF